ncbi:hypothetical protein LX32DRAFT_620545 [Colletotrichum zoysiae]|uniref:Uncharacterized protein n=1 Tax=Colletotrichum zoysiae TaxID=1216348 RepID=A0AAD9HEI2_9PEZI|nr:hypothetical protein LX32DRAFT_620545 [Colletotrichum zoysiae]
MSPMKKGPHEGGFVFVPISHPSESAGWKQKVRSHAAKRNQARRQRVVAYQETSAQSSSPSGGRDPEGTPSYPSSQHSDALAMGSDRGPLKSDHGTIFLYIPITFVGSPRTDPFNSHNRVITPWEKRLLDHFSQYLILKEMVCMPSVNLDILGNKGSFWKSMASFWLHTSLSDPGMLATTLLYSCRHMAAMQHSELLNLQATKYRLACIQLLNQALTTEGKDISNITITKTLALASDANTTGEHDAVAKHLEAAGQMVRVRNVGKEPPDFLGRLVIWFTGDTRSKNTISRAKVTLGTEMTPVAKVDKSLVYHVSAPTSGCERDEDI